MRTRVGYAGGTKPSPTYHSLGDHTETIQIDYDPARISYEDLLDLFWNSHDPTSKAWSRQYMAAVFYHNDDQRELALASRKRLASSGKKIQTQIVEFSGFTLAENYHQKHRLQREKDLMSEFSKIYPSFEDVIHSTAAARVNGYLGGYGTISRLKADLGRLGLSLEGGRQLERLVEARMN